MTTRTLNQLEKMRIARGISRCYLSECCGAHPRSWGQAVERNIISQEFKNNAIKVFKYYDRNGYLPEPREIGLEPMKKRLKK